MIKARELVEELAGRGVRLRAVDGRIAVQAPRGEISLDLRERILAQKADLLSLLAPLEAITPVGEQGSYALSNAQRRLWVLDQFEEAALAYHMPGFYELEGELEEEAFKTAFKRLLERHESLRTRFDLVDGEPRQKVVSLEELGFEVKEEDYRSLGEEAEAEAARIVAEELKRPFDLSKGPLVRAKLMKLAEKKWGFYFAMHHIVGDGWSMGVLVRDVLELYNQQRGAAHTKLPELKIQYKDYAAWQNAWLESEAAQKARAYWHEKLGGELPVLELPADHARPPVKTYEGAVHSFELGGEVLEGLEAIARENEATLFMVLVAAVKVLLYRYTGQEDIIVGAPVAGRDHGDLRDQIGFYVNTLALRDTVRGEDKFTELLGKVKETILSGYEHQYYPFDKLVEELPLSRDTSRSPIFDVMVVMNEAMGTPQMEGVSVTSLPQEHQSTKFDLTFFFTESDGKLGIGIEYNQDLLGRDRVLRIGEHLLELIKSLDYDRAGSVAELDILSDWEREKLLVGFNSTEMEYSKGKTIVDLFEEQVSRAPDNVAVVFRDERITYRELNVRANGLAWKLRTDHGVRPEVCVGLLMERSLETIVGILGILKAGGAYVPIDPKYPEERIKYMIEDAGLGVILSHGNHIRKIPASSVTINLDNVRAYKESTHGPETLGGPENLIYIIYTSGSTGKPKGVLIEHKGVIRLVKKSGYVELDESSRILQLASITFDASVFEIWGALLNGGTLVMYPSESLTVEELKECLRRHEVNTLWLTSTLFNSIVSEDCEALEGLRFLLIGGEALSGWHVKRGLEKLVGTTIINGYGPTECTTFAATHELKAGESIRIGKPINNTKITILREGAMVPIGIVGELCVSGQGLARGYLNDERLTAEKFVANPYEEGGTLYRTGDLGRWHADGTIEYLGRKDHQIKIRGYRVELGEIENALSRQEGVKAAVVKAWEEEGGDKSLVGYVSGEGIDVRKLREALKSELPEYMVPGTIVELEALPLNANGKVDRKALPKPEGRVGETQYEAPRDEIEKALVAIWEEVLGRNPIGVLDNFFELGGHSLKAIQLVSRVHRELGVELLVREVFETPTVKGQAEVIRAKEGKLPYEEIPSIEEAKDYALSNAQRRLWVLDQFEEAALAYHIPGYYELEGEFEEEGFKTAFKKLLERHESLRTRFDLVDGEPRQKVVSLEELGFEVKEEDYRSLGEEAEAEAARIVAEELKRPFDLSKGPLVRAKLMKLAEKKWGFYFAMHHIVGDGWSMGVLVRDVLELYNQQRGSGSGDLPKLRIQYKDYAAWQNAWLESEAAQKARAYWHEKLGGELPVLELPADHVRPPVKTYKGAVHSFELGGEVLEGLEAIARENEATLFMVLVAAVKVLLYRYTGQEDIIVGAPVAGRDHGDLRDQIGFYVNTLALRDTVKGEDKFTELLKSVKETILSGYEHQYYPFDKLVEELPLSRDTSRSPIFDVMVVMNEAMGTPQMEGVSVTALPQEHLTTKFDLTFFFTDSDGKLSIAIEYNESLFEADRIEQVGEYLGLLTKSILNADSEANGRLEIVPKNEGHRLRVVPFAPEEQTVIELFEKQVEQSSEQTAVVCGSEKLSYAELNARANRLGNCLREHFGVRAETCVGVLAERGIAALVGMLGILKAGGAYVPIDPKYPQGRIDFMVADSRCRVVLSQREHLGKVPAAAKGVDLEALELRQGEERSQEIGSLPENLIYVIYTSGSTGNPKGVMIENRGVSRLVRGANYLPMNAETRVLQMAPLTFDAATFEIWAPLLNGGELVIWAGGELEAKQIGKEIEGRKINTAWLTSALFNMIVDEAPDALSKLEYLLIGGEALSMAHVRRGLERLPKVKIINGYGPTECTTFTTTYAIGREKISKQLSVPIGKPISKTGVFLRDRQGGIIAASGLIGEICVTGPGLARGYLNDERLTAEKFIANPYEEGGRLYRTGDLGRWHADGTIEYLGRKDHQIKIRGYRVELGEIENALGRQEGVKAAVVKAWEEESGDKSLVGYVSGEGIDVRKLREALKSELPDYMVPGAIMELEALPLNANGKVDRKALPKPEGRVGETQYQAPRDETERQLVAIWEEVLGRNPIGMLDNFFELGGHSLKAIQVVSRVHRELGVELLVREVFETPTVRGQAEVIRAKEGKQAYEEIPRIEEAKDYALSNAQRRLWVLDQFEEAALAYHMPGFYELEGELEEEAFKKAFEKLLERHESLRTRFELADGEARQKVVSLEELGFEVEEEDYRSLGEEAEAEAARIVAEELKRPFDLSKGPLVRAKLMKLAERKWGFYFAMHHIVGDGWSMGVLVRDVLELYNQQRGVTHAELPQLKIQYKDYAAWQNAWLEGEAAQKARAYWHEKLGGELPVLDLPADHVRPPVKTYEGAVHSFELEGEVLEGLKAIARENEATLFMVLVAAVKVLLYRYTGQEDIIVGAPVAGRDHGDLRDQIGFYVNTLALRDTVRGEDKFTELLGKVKETILGGYEHQYYPFDKLVEELPLSRDTSRSPIFDVVVAMNEAIGTPRMEGFEVRALSQNFQTAKFDITFVFSEVGKSLNAQIIYNRNLYETDRIGRMVEHVHELARSMAKGEKIGTSKMLPEKEMQKLLRDFNDTAADYPQNKTLVDLFEEQVERTPKSVAVIYKNQQLTYRELNAKANALAQLLRTEHGMGADQLVGLRCERSLEMLVGILGILKAGGAYLPIDPLYPDELARFMMEDSQVKVVLVASHSAGNMGAEVSIVTLNVADLEAKQNPPSCVRGEDLAYVIYTSGSTGKPKGAMIEHRSIVNRLLWMRDHFNLGEKDVILQKTPYTFDVSVWELLLPPLIGAKLVFLAPGDEKNPEVIAEEIEKHGITTIHFVPSMLSAFLKLLAPYRKMPSLRRVLCSGEALNVSQKEAFFKRFEEVELHNLYGPTEAAVDVTCIEVKSEDFLISIGKPLANTSMYVLGIDGILQPQGVPGELYIGGIQVGRGYLNRPELTAEKFIENPYRHCGRMYRTGDLGRWLSNGTIEYLGRLDHQVKIRGNRIELQEIESVLQRIDGIQDAVVVKTESDEGGDLKAYVVPDENTGHLVRKQLEIERNLGLGRRDVYELPNGMGVYHLNRGETEFMFREIFTRNSYLKNGIRLPKKPVVFDIGANIGIFSLLIGTEYPDAKIFAFEPIPDIGRILKANLSLYCPGADVSQIGVGKGKGEARFTFYPSLSILSGAHADDVDERDVVMSFMSSSEEAQDFIVDGDLERIVDESLKKKLCTCSMLSLSEIMDEKRVDRIDLLKIDVEKSELDVLNGIDEADWKQISQIVVEVHDVENRLDSIVELLTEKGYEVNCEKDCALDKTNLYQVYAIRPQARQMFYEIEIQNEAVQLGTIPAFARYLKENLEKVLPNHLVPDLIVPIWEIPLNSNGKINRRELLRIESDAVEARYEAPSGAMELQLVQIWTKVFGKKDIGVLDNFFELGGHSLKAIQLVSLIHRELDAKLGIREVLEAPTVRALAELLGRRGGKLPYEEIPRIEEAKDYALSNAQRRLWVLDQFEEAALAYHMPGFYELEGELEEEAFKTAFKRLLERHESLRTRFELVDGEPRQKMVSLEELGFEVEEEDYRSLGEEAEAEAARKVAEELRRPFDLSKGPLVRAKLMKLGEKKWGFYFAMHHIVGDGWSMGVLVRDVLEIYNQQRGAESEELPELRIQYKDYAAWQNAWLESEAAQKARAYWHEKLGGELPVLDLPADHVRPPVKTYEGAVRSFELEGEVLEGLKEVARKNEATLFMVLVAAVKVLLYRYTGQEDIIVGAPVAGRDHGDLRDQIGFYVNTLALRDTVRGEDKFTDLLGQVKETMLSGYEHQYYPFDKLVEELPLARDPSRSPLFDVMVVMNEAIGTPQMEGVAVTSLPQEQTSTKFDLTFDFTEYSGKLGVHIGFNKGLFFPSRVARMEDHIKELSKSIVDAGCVSLGGLEILSFSEKHKLLHLFNDTKAEYATDKTIIDLFEEQVQKTPDQIAVVFKDERLSFWELNEKANEIGHLLRSRHDIGANDVVGILCDRSLEMIIGIFGILKAGGAYLPIDLNYPPERQNFILKNSQAKALVGQPQYVRKLDVSAVELNVAEIKGRAENLKRNNEPKDLGYVIYTSGSTGEPKGVMVEHQSIVNRLLWMRDHYGIGKGDSILQKTNYTFDVSVWELLLPELVGARLVLLPPGDEKDPDAITKAIEEHGISIIHFVPAMLDAWTMTLQDGFSAKRLRMVICSGEVLTGSHKERFFKKLPEAALHNLYGPTEATVDVTACEIGRDDTVIPIGRPVANTEIYILDAADRICPIGIAGQLCIGGRQLARGYINRSELTEQRFTPNPIEKSLRIYRTGDLARWLPDGNIEYLGRMDSQIKIRGQRIEAGEIEFSLCKIRGIRQALVICYERTAGDKYLCAYICGEPISEDILRSKLARVLPEYMIPELFVWIEEFPTSRNGKIDATAFQSPPDRMMEIADFDSPRCGLEEKIAENWKEVLNLSVVGRRENFFMIGGNSLSAIRLSSRLNVLFGLQMSIAEIFKARTIVDQAAMISEMQPRDGGAVMREPAFRDGWHPLSSAQKRLWFLYKLNPGSTSFNMPLTIRLRGSLNLSKFNAAVAALLERHEMLRTVFKEEAGVPYQRVCNEVAPNIRFMDLVGERGSEHNPMDLVREEKGRFFDLTEECPFRVLLLKVREAEFILVIHLHHIIADEWSLRLVIRDLVALYTDLTANSDSRLSKISFQYIDYIYGQVEREALEMQRSDLKFWAEKLNGTPVLDLPCDRSYDSARGKKGGRYSVTLDPEVYKDLMHLCNRTGATLFMTLMASFQLLLSRLSGSNDIAVGFPMVNRENADLEPIVGLFLNTLVVRMRFNDEMLFLEMLDILKEEVLESFGHRDIPFERLVEELNPQRDLDRNPIFDAMLNFVDAFPLTVASDEIEALPLGDDDEVEAKYALTLYASEANGTLALSLVYRSIFSEQRAENMLRQFEILLAQIAKDPERPIKSYSLITNSEKLLLPDPTSPLPKGTYPSVIEAILKCGEKFAGRKALEYGENSITYAELILKASEITRDLLRYSGDGNDVIAIIGSRGCGLVISMIGALMAGKAFALLDSGLPIARLKAMVLESNARFAIDLTVGDSSESWIGEIFLENIIKIDPEHGFINTAGKKEEISSSQSTAVKNCRSAYVFFTSGTTGTPRGVMGSLDGLSQFVSWQKEEFQIDENDRCAQLTNMSFDVILRDIFLPLVSGACLCIPRNNEDSSGMHLFKWLDESGISVMHVVPTLLSSWLLQYGDVNSRMRKLRWIFFAGEPLKASLIREWKSSFPDCNARMVNLYGPTETTLAKFFHVVPDDFDTGIVPVGKPIPHCQGIVINDLGTLCGIGEIGEVYIRTPYRSLGYTGKMGTDAFLANPFTNSDEDIVYRSGDMGRYIPDGSIELVGRRDRQLKINGTRIDPFEISEVLCSHAEIEACTVIAGDAPNGARHLIAYIVAPGMPVAKTAELKGYLSAILPQAFIPAIYVRLDQLPVTNNGKIDYSALPAPPVRDTLSKRTPLERPRTRAERDLYEIWTAVLMIEGIGIYENFFELGGTSLHILHLFSKLEELYPKIFTVAILFSKPTIAQQAGLLDEISESKEVLELEF